MCGAWLKNISVGLALLLGGASTAVADVKYDRNLESAVKEIVARKMKSDIRGSLGAEWRPAAETAARPVDALGMRLPSPTFVEVETRLPSDSILGYRMPALTTSAIKAVGSIIEVSPPDRKVRVVYF